MDILSHTLSGLAAGTVLASFAPLQFSKWKIILFGGIGGALPDIDAISLWSHFDHTIGRWFNLTHSGEAIYTGKFWYSHHAFMHSMLCSLILSAFIYVWNRKKDSNKVNGLQPISFFLGFNLHLLEDMPTPVGAWNGVNYFFPSPHYIGGFSKIWWWNNYDLFLIIAVVFLLNCLLLLSTRLKKLTVIIFTIGVLIFIKQIQDRNLNYTLNSQKYGYMNSETKSLELQKKILGKHIYTFMEKFDSLVKINF